MGRAGLDQFAGIVAVAASHHDYGIARLSQFDSVFLSLLGGLADGVAKDNIGAGEPLANAIDQIAHSHDRLRRLRDDAIARFFREALDILWRFDDGALLKIA